MNHFYIDDCRKDASRLHILGGLIINESDYGDLRAGFADLKRGYGLSATDPVKWSPPRRVEFAAQRAILDQNGFRKDVLRYIGQSPLLAVATVIEESGQYNRQRRDVYLCDSLEFLAQILQVEVAERNSTGRMILDYPGEHHQVALMKRYSLNKATCSNYPTPGVELSLLDETIYYTNDFACDGLQLSDFAVGAIGHSLENRRYEYARIISGRIRRIEGQIKGTGIIVYPSNSTTADSLIAACQEA